MADRSQNSFIRTQRYELWRRLRWGALLIPAWNLFRSLSLYAPAISETIGTYGVSPASIFTCAVILTLALLFNSTMPFILWWCACTFLMSRSRREATFSPTQDLEYYRDKLGGVTAAQVSMLADLRVEPREDAAATLLALAMKGAISLDGGRVTITNHDALAKRPRNERLLAQFAAAGQLDAATTREWAAIAEGEAADGILLERLSEKDGGILPYAAKGCGTGCLVIIAGALLFALIFMTGQSSYLELIYSFESDSELVGALMQQPLFAVETLILIALFIAVVVGFLLPFIDGIRGFVENGDASKRFRRTALGEQVTECVYGIRNYLRDFTSLSDADRSALMLWDEFAVYALALGDNASAVDEILASRGFDRSMLGL